MTGAQLRDKVTDCLAFGRSRGTADELIAAVRGLRDGRAVSTVLQLLT